MGDTYIVVAAANLASTFVVTVLMEGLTPGVPDLVVLPVTVCVVPLGWISIFGKQFLINAELTNSFRIALQVRSEIGLEALKCISFCK